MRWLPVLLIAACGSGGGPVTITGVDTWVTGEASGEVDADLSALEAYGIDGDRLVPLTITLTPGGASIDGAGDVYYLYYRDRWIAARDRELSLGRTVLGRPDLVLATAPASLSMVLSGASPWQTGDLFQMYSPGAALWMLDALELAPGTTDLSLVIDFATAGLFRVQGDRTWAAQLSPRSYEGRSYLAVGRGIELPSFDLSLTPNPSFGATLIPPPETDLALHWRVNAFDQMRLRTHPVVVTSFYDLGVAALPGAAAGHYGLAADLAVLRIDDAAGQELFDTFSYANPFPDDWDVMLTAVAWYPNEHRASDTDLPVVLFDGIWVRDLVGTLAAGPIEPSLSPPGNLRLDGAPAEDGVAVGDLAELSWDPPDAGDAAGYEVEVYALTSDQGSTTATRTALLVTSDTAVRLPPELFDSAAAGHVVRVAAIAAPVDLGAAPLALGLPYAWASAQTGVLRR